MLLTEPFPSNKSPEPSHHDIHTQQALEEEFRPNITFPNPEFDGALDRLGTLNEKLSKIVNHTAKLTYGENARQHPATIEVSPKINEDGTFILSVRSGHPSLDREGKEGLFEDLQADFDLVPDEPTGNVYLRQVNHPDEPAYELSTLEAINLIELEQLTRRHHANGLPTEEPPDLVG